MDEKALKIENTRLKLQVLELQSIILQYQHNEQKAILGQLEIGMAEPQDVKEDK